ncbi:MAG: hypothetical protein AB7E60_01715 [Sphingobium sp.]
MTVIGVPSFSAPGVATDPSRPFPVRDPLLKGVANDGVRFMFDLAFPWCYPGGPPAGRPAPGDPAPDLPIYDMSEHANGVYRRGSGDSLITYAGGGFDLSASQIVGGLSAGVVAPASALADIWTPFGGKAQRFLITAWLKLPALSNWNDAVAIMTVIGDRTYVSGQSLLLINFRQGGLIDARRQNAAGVIDGQVIITPDADDYGSVVQIAAWRNDAGQGFRLRSANGTILQSTAVGADNTENFGGNDYYFGRSTAFVGQGTGVVSGVNGLRIYRGWIENLARSGRNPTAALDADWDFQAARGLFG